jgi:diguanylate cyclase (GGDEF)-like protein/PAS domain S-box-containing protein
MTEANPAIARMLGYSVDELLGMDFREYTHPDDIEHNLVLFRELMAGERDSYDLEKRCYRKDRKLIWVRVTVSLERDEDGHPAFAIAMLEDVTKRRETELRYRTLIDQLPLVTYVSPLDLSRPKLYVSPQIEQLLGYPADEWQTNPDLLAKVIHPDDLERVVAASLRSRQTAATTVDEYRCIAADGRVVWLLDGMYAARDAQGDACIRGYLVDITDRKQAEFSVRASEARVRAVLESALDAIITIDDKGRILEFNPAAEAMFGRSQEDAVGARMVELLIPPALRDAHNRGFERLLTTGEGPIMGQRVESTALRADGSEFPIELAVSRVVLEGPPLFTGYVRDISKQKLAETQIRKSAERYRDLFENGSEPIATVDLEGTFTEINSAFAAALGYTCDELLGSNLEHHLTPEGLAAAVLHRDRKLSAQETQSTYEQTFVSKSGRHVILEASTRLIEENGVPVGVQGTCRDITARKESDKELLRLAELNRHQALHDQLTGLPNRTQLHERIEQCLVDSRTSRTGFALMMIDLDRFKEINDSLGHHSGDDLLREVAGRLESAVRGPDIVARLGGDEFGILLPGLSDGQPAWVRRVEEIKRALEQPVFVQGIPIAVEASIGIAFYPSHGDNVELLLQRADVAMYVAKHENRGHAMYNAQEDDNNATKLSLLGRLRHAIDNGELVLHYQPMLDLRTEKVTRVEALVRWQHPSHGFLLPAQFIPIAERTALIKPLTRYVLGEAVRQCKQWERDGHDLSVAVNLSTRNLSEPDLVEDIVHILSTCQLEPGKLLLEITESAIMSDPVRTEGVLRTLSGLGIKLAVDDFGAGYTSLAYLAKLPLDQLKIDRSFVAGILEDDNDRAIVQAIVHLCKDLGLQVVAEGVETLPTLDELNQLDCDLMQGYHLSKPLAPDDLIRWLEQHKQLADKAA